MAEPGPTRRGRFAALKDYFLPPPIQPVEVPVTPINDQPLSREEAAQLRRDQANAIDKYFDEELDKEIYDQLNDDQRKLQWRPDITPSNDANSEWQLVRQNFIERLRTQTVHNVVEDSFEEAQKILLYPLQGHWTAETQRIRNEQSREYYANLSAGGAFHGQFDNLATKLTMLHFGLPIAPMTENNITVINADWDGSRHDLPDEPPPPLRQQRIIYTETPLQFLDSYNERSWGFPTIRRPQPRLRGGAGCIDELDVDHDDELDIDHDDEIQWGLPVGMRGGSGGPPEPPGPPRPRLHIQHGRAIQQVEPINAEQCTRVIRTLLGQEEDDVEHRFQIDIYTAEDAGSVDMVYADTRLFENAADLNANWEAFVQQFGLNTINTPLLHVNWQRRPDSEPRRSIIYEDRFAARGVEWRDAEQKWMYSWAGKIRIPWTYPNFERTVRRLLNYTPQEDMAFFVEIHNTQDNTSREFRCDGPRLQNVFATQFSQTNHREFFVRRVDSPHSTSLEPPAATSNIVVLAHQEWAQNIFEDTIHMYWKIPDDFDRAYGTNQLQRAFAHASTVIALAHVTEMVVMRDFNQPGLAPLDLGVGAMEVHGNTWAFLRRIIERHALEQQLQQQPALPRIRLDNRRIIALTDRGEAVPEDRTFVLRLIGSSRSWAGDYEAERANGFLGLWAQIVNFLQLSQREGVPRVARLYFWELDTEEVPNNHHQAWPLDLFPINGGEFTDAQKAGIMRIALAGRVSPGCFIWVRPQYTHFNVRDAGDRRSNVAIWNTQPSESLASFRDLIRTQLFQRDWDEVADQNFTLIDLNRRDGTFVITQYTTEEQWQSSVFDWLTSTNIYVMRKTAQPFMPRDNVLWGWRHRLIDIPEPPPDPHPAPVQPVFPQEPRVPKSRLILQTAARVKTPRWETWMTDQHRLDNLQQRSYVQDQSVIEPGLDPAAPLYGQSRELQIGQSFSTPIVFTQRLTPTDIATLMEENQRLRNGLLERTYNCPICSLNVEGYQHTDILDHFYQHLVQLQTKGKCPLCGSDAWSIMTMEQQKQHLDEHQAGTSTEVMRRFWDEMECYVCDAKLQGFSADRVLQHMADHVPGIVENCDRCGLRLSICTPEEQFHHRYACLEQPYRQTEDPEPIFCEDCGLRRTNETDEQRAEHTQFCTSTASAEERGIFCVKCGIEKTHWNNELRAAHDRRCRPPGGTSKKFCRRCGTEFAYLTTQQLNDHKRFCGIRTRHPQNIRLENEELKKRIEEQKRLAAKNAAAVAWTETRERDIENRETVLANREAQFANNHPQAPDIDGGVVFEGGNCAICANNNTPHAFTRETTRQELFDHLQQHANDAARTEFTCPIPNCGSQITIPTAADALGGQGIRVIDHYRHRTDGIADARPIIPPRGHRPPPDSERQLRTLLEHFNQAQLMHERTERKSATPIPEAGSFWKGTGGGGGGGGGGVAGGYLDQDAMRSGYSFRDWGSALHSRQGTGEAVVYPSVEVDESGNPFPPDPRYDDYYEGDEPDVVFDPYQPIDLRPPELRHEHNTGLYGLRDESPLLKTPEDYEDFALKKAKAMETLKKVDPKDRGDSWWQEYNEASGQAPKPAVKTTSWDLPRGEEGSRAAVLRAARQKRMKDRARREKEMAGPSAKRPSTRSTDERPAKRPATRSSGRVSSKS